MMENKPLTTNENQSSKKQKRKRPYGESRRIAYSSISFSPRESTGRPSSPQRFFSSSHSGTFTDQGQEEGEGTHNNGGGDASSLDITQVVHHHVNGLCIVTAGEKLPTGIQSITFVAKEAPACSAAEKRKRQGKMLKGGKVEDSVAPGDVIAQLKLETGETIPLYACVWGTILELNHSLTPQVLLDDPLLDGFLAVILPSGNFPPETEAADKKDTENDASGNKDASNGENGAQEEGKSAEVEIPDAK